MRMDRSCCWKGDFSALLRGKVTFLVGRVCLVPVNTALCAGVWPGAWGRCPASPYRRPREPWHRSFAFRTIGRPPHRWVVRLKCRSSSPAMSHVIPLPVCQDLKFDRWNCNVCGLSRKMTALNYVRLLEGRLPPSLSGPSTGRGHRGLAPRCAGPASTTRSKRSSHRASHGITDSWSPYTTECVMNSWRTTCSRTSTTRAP